MWYNLFDMKNAIYFIVGAGIIGGFVSADGESLLKPVSFPKSFDDVPFVARMEILADGYKDYETIYDNATGRCISGCAYAGITIEDETEAIARNTRRANDAINAYIVPQTAETTPTRDVVQPTSSSQPQPQANDVPTTPSQTIPQPTPQQTQPSQPIQTPLTNPSGTSSITQTCSPHRVVKATDIPWNSPIAGDIRISSDFGPRQAPTAGATSWHKGIDIPVPTGTPIYVTANGTIEYISDQGNTGGGKYVVVKHGNTGFRSAYFHLSNNRVLKVGDRVRAGDKVGISGNTGSSTGPHLHYAVYYTKSGQSFGWGQDVIDPLWVKNYLDTRYKFKSQSTKSCLHNPRNFCAKESQTQQKPPETLPCEVK